MRIGIGTKVSSEETGKHLESIGTTATRTDREFQEASAADEGERHEPDPPRGRGRKRFRLDVEQL
jgi:hypothetical protein